MNSSCFGSLSLRVEPLTSLTFVASGLVDTCSIVIADDTGDESDYAMSETC